MSATARDGAAGDVAALAADLRLVVGRLSRRLRAHPPGGLTLSQLSALATVEEHGPLRLTDLAAREGVALPTASRAVDQLVQHGLVGRSADPADARCALLALTPEGSALLAGWRQERAALLAAHLHTLTPADLDRLRQALPVLRAVLAGLG